MREGRNLMSAISRRTFSRAIIGTAGIGLVRPPTSFAREGASRAASGEEPGRGSITDVPGIKAGHFTDPRRPTGCTALLFDGEATAGVDYDGSAPGSYLGVLLQPVSPIETIHGMLLTG